MEPSITINWDKSHSYTKTKMNWKRLAQNNSKNKQFPDMVFPLSQWGNSTPVDKKIKVGGIMKAV